MLQPPQLDCGLCGQKNNEVNNTGTVQQGTRPCLFLSPVPHTTAFLSLLHPVDHANTSVSINLAGIEGTRVPAFFLVSFHLVAFFIDATKFTHFYSMWLESPSVI